MNLNFTYSRICFFLLPYGNFRHEIFTEGVIGEIVLVNDRECDLSIHEDLGLVIGGVVNHTEVVPHIRLQGGDVVEQVVHRFQSKGR